MKLEAGYTFYYDWWGDFIITPAAIALTAFVGATPTPGSSTHIHDNKIILRFSEPVKAAEITITDSSNCVVSRESKTDGNTVIVVMKACSRLGYPKGPMRVNWKVNGQSGSYSLNIKPHH